MTLAERPTGSAQWIYSECGMLRVQPSCHGLGLVEQETLESMTSEGLRETQFSSIDPEDVERAKRLGWSHKLIEFHRSPHSQDDDDRQSPPWAAVLDSTAGFVKSSDACAFLAFKARERGVKFVLGPAAGCFTSLLERQTEGGRKRAEGIRTKDGKEHKADLVVIAGKRARLATSDAPRDIDLIRLHVDP
jgi:sarcosine oxidase / L-pipecolate oxidase